MSKGSKKMSFGKSTGEVQSTIKKGGSQMGGRRKGPPAPNMLNPKRGHMSGRAVVPSRLAEAALRQNPTGPEAQDWKTRHFGDVCLLLHPQATVVPEEAIAPLEDEDEEGPTPRAAKARGSLDAGVGDEPPEPEPQPELVEVPANNLLAYLDKGFMHATPEPDPESDEEPEEFDFAPAVARNLRGPLTRGAVVSSEREAAEIEAKNAEVIARKAKAAEGPDKAKAADEPDKEKAVEPPRGSRFAAKKDD